MPVWYVINNGRVEAKCYYQPDPEKLTGKTIVSSNEDIDIFAADFVNGQVVQHVTTQAEIDADADKVAANQAKTDARNSAMSKLVAIGLTDDEIKALLGV